MKKGRKRVCFKRTITFLLACTMLLTLIPAVSFAAAADPVYLTENGAAASQILLPATASDMEEYAAAELQYHAKLVSGATLPIVTQTIGGVGFSASVIGGKITTVTGTYHYPVEVQLENPTEEALTLTLSQLGPADGQPVVSFRGEAGMEEGQVTLDAGSNMVVSGIVTVPNATTFKEKTIQVAVSNGSETLETLDLTIIGRLSGIGTALNDGFEADIDDWSMVTEESDAPSEPEEPTAPENVKLDSEVGNTVAGSMKIEGAGTASYGSKLTLVSGNLYKLTFSAKADAATSLYANVKDEGTTAPYSLRNLVEVTTGWQEYEFRFVANIGEDSSYTASVLQFENLGGNVWIDDITLVSCGEAPASMVGNSGFEDSAYGSWFTPGVGWAQADDKYTGSKSMILYGPTGEFCYDSLLGAASGHQYTLSFWAKSINGTNHSFAAGVDSYYDGWNKLDGGRRSETFALTDAWSRYEVPVFATPDGAESYYLIFQLATTGIILLDNFTLIDTTAADTATEVILSSDFGATEGALEITGAATANYGSKAMLVSGNLYKLTFDAEADAATSLYASVKDEGTTAPYSLRNLVDITTETQTYEFRFVANIGEDTGYTGSTLQFESLGGNVRIDNVALVNCGKASASMIGNSGFEDSTYGKWFTPEVGWAQADDKYTGSKSMILYGPTGEFCYDALLSVTSGHKYTLSFWAKSINGEDHSFTAGVDSYYGGWNKLDGGRRAETFALTDSWTRYEVPVFTTPEGAESFYVIFKLATTGIILLDNFTLIDTTAADTATDAVQLSDVTDGWNVTASAAPEAPVPEAKMERDTEDKVTGEASLKLSGGVTANNSVNMPMISGNLYRLTFQAKAEAGNSLTVAVGDKASTGDPFINSLYSYVDVSTGWQAFEYRFVANLSEAQNYASSVLSLLTEGDGSVWIDDLLIVDCGAAPESLMKNSGFEDSPLYGGASRWFTASYGDLSDDAYTGSSALLLNTANEALLLSYDAALTVKPGNQYTVSFWAKNAATTDSFNVNVRAHLNIWSNDTEITEARKDITIQPTDEWVRYEMTYTNIDTANINALYFSPVTTGMLLDNFALIDTTAAETADGTLPEVDPGELPEAPEIPAPVSPDKNIVIATTTSMPALAEMFPDHYAELTDGDGFDGFAIDEKDGVIYIWGTSEKGALNGVYDFIEENMGVIWMRAEDIAYDPMPSIAVTKVGYMEESPFEVRGWHLCGTGDNGEPHSDPETEIMMSRNKMSAKLAELPNEHLWQWQDSIGIKPFNLTHNVTEWILNSPSYDTADTKYWCTDEDGNPLDGAYNRQVNFWYEGTATAITDSVLDFLEERDYLEYIGVGIMDTWYSTCRPYDQMKFNFVTGEVVEDSVAYDPDTMVRPEDPEYLSTVFFTMLNKIAKAVAAEYPDVTVTTFAYYFTEIPPKCDIEDNICVVFAPIDEDLAKPLDYPLDPNKKILDNLKNWETKTDNIVIYNYYGCFPNASKEYERPLAERIQEHLQFYADQGYTGMVPEGIADSGTNKNDWAMNALTFWLYSKLCWDPYADIDELTEYFCEKVYGDAAEEMLQYYTLLKQGWDEGVENTNLHFGTIASAYYKAFVLDPELGEEMLAALDAAWAAAEGDETARARIQYIRDTFAKNISAYLSIPDESPVALKTDADKATILGTFDMTDPIWADAPVLDNFYDSESRRPVDGISTKARLLWDEEYIYVAYENFDDNMENLIASDKLTDSGNWWAANSCDVETFITAGDTTKSYGYFGNPYGFGVRYNGRQFDPAPESWSTTAKILDDRWVLIQAIPFADLGITGDATTDTEVSAYFFRTHFTDPNTYKNVGWNGAAVWADTFMKPIELQDVSEPVDRTELEAAIETAEGLNGADYTAESWAVLVEALEAAKNLGEDASQADVDEALAVLKDAMEALEEKEEEPIRPPVRPNQPHPSVPGVSGTPEAPAVLPFTDVPANAWYYDEVKEAWEKDLIDGMTADRFDPNGSLTVAQAIKLAASLHQMYHKGEVTLTNGASNWFDSYVDYAVANGIIEARYDGYTLAEMNAPVSREEFVHIFFGAMPANSYYARNSVADNAIPDVKVDDDFADEIYTFYRAGILTGSDAKGTFYPESSIKRSEVAAILIRMYETDARQAVTLH